MLLFAAMLQVDVPSMGPRGMLGYAWNWLANFLNYLPVNRVRISALQQFLNLAGDYTTLCLRDHKCGLTK